MHNQVIDPSICNEGYTKADGKLERTGLRFPPFLLDQKLYTKFRDQPSQEGALFC